MLTGGGVFVFLGMIVSLDSLLGNPGPGSETVWGVWYDVLGLLVRLVYTLCSTEAVMLNVLLAASCGSDLERLLSAMATSAAS
jgi:hypothetical protein